MDAAADRDCTPMDAPMTETDIMSDFFAGVMQLAGEAQRKLTGKRLVRGGSQALAFAVEAGLRPQAYYTVAEVAMFTGVPRATLYREHSEGRLFWKCPKGSSKGALVSVREVDRWMEENA